MFLGVREKSKKVNTTELRKTKFIGSYTEVNPLFAAVRNHQVVHRKLLHERFPDKYIPTMADKATAF